MNPFSPINRYLQTKRAWLGGGGVPVPKEQAQQRANVCLKCPINQPHPIYENLARIEADALREQIELKNRMKLTVEGEEKLHVCEGCWCVLSVKVWVPFKHLLHSTPLDAMNKENPTCWVLSENEGLSTTTE